MIEHIKVAFLGTFVILFAFFVFHQPDTAPGIGGDYTYFTNPIAVEQFTQGGNVLVIATTSATSTLTAFQLDEHNVIELSSTTATSVALVLPATSTMAAANIIVNAGDFREWIIDNQRTGASTTIIAGTGIDLLGTDATGAGAGADVLDANEKARLSCWRKSNTDVGCIVVELLAAD